MVERNFIFNKIVFVKIERICFVGPEVEGLFKYIYCVRCLGYFVGLVSHWGETLMIYVRALRNRIIQCLFSP